MTDSSLAGELRTGTPIRSGTTRGAALILAAVSVAALAGCDGVVGARMTFDDTEPGKVTEVVLTGGAGNVTVESDATATATAIRRVVYGGTDPGGSYQLTGGVLTLDGDCGHGCRVDFVITTRPGTKVRGELRSGDVMLRGTGPVDLKLTSGDVRVESSTGPVKVRTTSGDIDLELAAAASVTVSANSGDISLMVPSGSYRVRAVSGSGDRTVVGITDDPASAEVLELRTGGGDVTVIGG